jgi:hypothetical protein
MRMRRPLLLAALAGILANTGCAVTSGVSSPESDKLAPSGLPAERPAPSPRFSAGRSIQDFRFPAGEVTTAVLEAMEDLKITVTRRDHDGLASQIEGRTSDNRTVTVTLRPQKPITRVSCRIGWFGDEPLSRTLLQRVGVRLGVLPPEAIPDSPPSQPASNPYFSRDAVPDSEMMRDFYEAPYRNRPDI